MNLRSIITTFVLLNAFCLISPSLAAPAPRISKPNIVLIYIDDLGYGDVGCYGATTVKTPNVDRIAETGLRFTSAYASSATCTPSRYSLLTGEYAFRKPGTDILPGDAGMVIEPGRITLPSLLKSAGYTTGVVGKWHLGLGETGRIDWNGEIRPGPQDIGFDYSFVMAATGDRVPCVYVENRRVVGLDPADPIQVSYKTPFPGERTGKTNRESLKLDWSEGHNMAVINGVGRIGYMKGGKAAIWKDEDMADEFTKHALAFIERSKDHPFFLYFATQDIHVPRMPHSRFRGRSGMGVRGDAIVQMDWCVGEVLKKLDELKLRENTLVLFTSDNGPVLDDGYKDEANERAGNHRPSGPWRAGKFSPFEGGVRVPFIVSWPARVKPGTSGALISQVDLCASFAALTGVGMDTAHLADSFNVLPALLGETDAGRDSVVLQGANSLALREGNWVYLPPSQVRDGWGPWHLVKIGASGSPVMGALYNLEEDPGQRRDLAAALPERTQAMRDKLEHLKRVPGRIAVSAQERTLR